MDDNTLRDGLAALTLMALAWAALGILARWRVGRNRARASLLVAYAVSSLATGAALFVFGRLGASPVSLGLVVLLSLGALIAACLGIPREVVAPGHAPDEQLALAHEVQIGAQDLFGAGEAILAVMAQQSVGVGAQIAAVAQTSATVEEVKVSAQQATQLAEAVATTAREADRIAAVGVTAIQDATGGMTHIRERVESIADQILALSEQSQQIGEIIATVGDLADQSNMLALNAAIEAARAGEHGRGFAVVAQEIRVLAEQSKLATAQVRTILSDIQRVTNAAVMATEEGTKGVDAGARLIDSAGETIAGLAAVIQDGSTSAQQITVAVQQHSVGMDQIVAAMIDIQRVTEQNGLTGTASREAAEALIELAGRLNTSVQRYHATPQSDRLTPQPRPLPPSDFNFSSEIAA
jgi:hypothetical protein